MIKKYLLFFYLTIIICAGYAQELALANKDGKFGYLNRNGEWHIEPQFVLAKNFSENLAAAMNDDKKWGYINRKGEWVIQPSFKKAKYFNSGIAIVLSKKDWIYIDASGEQILNDVNTDHLFDFSEGFAKIRRKGRIGFINTSGETIVEPTFEVATNFFNGFSRVIYKDDFGLIDTEGNYFLEPEYTFIPKFIYDKNYISVKKRKTPGLIVDGNFKPIEGANRIWGFLEGSNLTQVYINGKFGFVNNVGSWIIEPRFNDAKGFSNGLAPIKIKNRWGYINTLGEIVIPCEFIEAEPFSKDGFALIFSGDGWGFINKNGEIIAEPKYQILMEKGFGFIKFQNLNRGFNNGLARVKYKKKWGFINSNGELLNNTWYKNLELFN